MNTQEQNEILSDLNNFNGSEEMFKASMLYNLNLTEGIQYLREKLKCYWLIDIVGSTQNLIQIRRNSEFIIWKIKREGQGCIVNAWKDSPFTQENLLYEQKIPYTDFKLNEYEFYQEGNILLLKGEH